MGPGNSPKGKLIVFKIDYEGVGKWMSGSWKTKQPYIKSIKAYCDRIIGLNEFKVRIDKVDGHSNNFGNDKADLLAKNTQTFSNFDKFVF
jgi:ribonuclease HI